jgi:hypothetical protein
MIEDLAEEKPREVARPVLAGAAGLILLLGLGTGYLLAGRTGKGTGSAETTTVQKGKEVGSTDIKTFRDTAVGILEAGGLDGEGTHKLIREGGPSQTAYLTSSVVDLNQFVGKKVQVWGETFKGQKAGWLMDVGRIKALE